MKQRFAGLRTAGRAAVIAALLLVLGGVLATGYFMANANAAPKVPAPTISSSPANPTTLTSATFHYSDSQSGVSFKCALDSPTFSTCATSGVTYSNLAIGSHTFGVEAISGPNTSSATSFSWTINPPAPTINNHPTNPTTSPSASFTYSDTASGTNFKCSLDGASFSSCATSGTSYSNLSGGPHTFSVEAVFGTSLVSTPTSFAWSITVPPAPTITAHPANPTTISSASFTYTDTESGVSFRCSLDGAAYSSCATSGTSYTNLSGGPHSFSVEAVFGTSLVSTPTNFAWSITTLTPSVTSEPANPTKATSATFHYSDTQAGVTFRCSLDGSSYSTCSSSGTTYTGLADGNHTFSVEAQLGSGPLSSPASYTWRVDTTAPSITITFPANFSADNAAGWLAGCTPVGICGTAADPSGVSNVAVEILQWSTGKYWNGTSFSSSSPVFLTATGTTSWNYGFLRPSDNVYSVFVRATDSLGNTASSSNLATAVFVIDTAVPPAPVITSEPANPTMSTSATFKFTDANASIDGFSCKLDSGSWGDCGDATPYDQGEMQYSNLTAGNHCFYVEATDFAGNTSPTTNYCWTIGATATISMVSGSPQSTDMNATYTSPLVAKLTNSSGNPLSGYQVTFTAPSSGASGSFAASGCTNASPTTTCVVTTGTNGLATSSIFTANGTPGAFTVTAMMTSADAPVDFLLTNGDPFTVSGSAVGKLYPGATPSVIPVTVHNPNSFEIYVTSITITAANATCNPSTNLSIHQVDLSTATNPGQLAIPAGGTVTLPAQGVAEPTIQLIDTHMDQTAACAGQTFTLSYSGSAQP